LIVDGQDSSLRGAPAVKREERARRRRNPITFSQLLLAVLDICCANSLSCRLLYIGDSQRAMCPLALWEGESPLCPHIAFTS